MYQHRRWNRLATFTVIVLLGWLSWSLTLRGGNIPEIFITRDSNHFIRHPYGDETISPINYSVIDLESEVDDLQILYTQERFHTETSTPFREIAISYPISKPSALGPGFLQNRPTPDPFSGTVDVTPSRKRAPDPETEKLREEILRRTPGSYLKPGKLNPIQAPDDLEFVEMENNRVTLTEGTELSLEIVAFGYPDETGRWRNFSPYRHDLSPLSEEEVSYHFPDGVQLPRLPNQRGRGNAVFSPEIILIFKSDLNRLSPIHDFRLYDRETNYFVSEVGMQEIQVSEDGVIRVRSVMDLYRDVPLSYSLLLQEPHQPVAKIPIEKNSDYLSSDLRMRLMVLEEGAAKHHRVDRGQHYAEWLAASSVKSLGQFAAPTGMISSLRNQNQYQFPPLGEKVFPGFGMMNTGVLQIDKSNEDRTTLALAVATTKPYVYELRVIGKTGETLISRTIDELEVSLGLPNLLIFHMHRSLDELSHFELLRFGKPIEIRGNIDGIPVMAGRNADLEDQFDLRIPYFRYTTPQETERFVQKHTQLVWVGNFRGNYKWRDSSIHQNMTLREIFFNHCDRVDETQYYNIVWAPKNRVIGVDYPSPTGPLGFILRNVLNGN